MNHRVWMSSRSVNEAKTTEGGGSQKRRRSENSHQASSSSGHRGHAKKTKLSASSFEDDVSDDELVVIELFSSDEQEKSSKSRPGKRSDFSQDKMPITKNDAENSQISPINNNTSIFKKFKKQNERSCKEKADIGVDSEPMFTQKQEDTDIPLLPWPKKLRKTSGQTSSQNSGRPAVKEVPSIPLKDSSSDEEESFASILNKQITKRTTSSKRSSSVDECVNRNVSSGKQEPLDVSPEISPVFKRNTEHNKLSLRKKSANVSSDSFSDLMVVETSDDSCGEKKTKVKEQEEETDASDGFVTIGRGKHFTYSHNRVRGTQRICQARGQGQNKLTRGFSGKKNYDSLSHQKKKKKTRKSFKLTSSSSDENDWQQNRSSSDDDLSCHSTLSSDDSNFSSTMSGKPQSKNKNKDISSKSCIAKRKDSAIMSESDEDTEFYEHSIKAGHKKQKEAASQSNLFVSQKIREKLKQSVSSKISSEAKSKSATPLKSAFASKESLDHQRFDNKKKPYEVPAEVTSDDEMTQPPDSYIDSQDDSDIFVIGLEDEATQLQQAPHQGDHSATLLLDLPCDLPPAADLPQTSDDDATQPLELDPQPDEDLTQPLVDRSDDEMTQPPSPSMFGEPPMLTPHSSNLSLIKNSVSLNPPELSLQQTMSLKRMHRSVSELNEPPKLSEQLSRQEPQSTVSPSTTIAHDSFSEHSSDTETFPDLDETSKQETVEALKKVSSRSGGSTDSNASQSCLTFKPVIVIDDGKNEHDKKESDVNFTSKKLQFSNFENIEQTQSKSNFTSGKSVTFDLDIPIDVSEIKKELLSEDSQTVKGTLLCKAPCYTQEEDVIFVYDSSDDEALLDLSQTNIRSDHLSDDMLDIFDHSDTELFDDDFNHDKTIPEGEQSSTLEELAQENKNPFDHLGESDSDDAIITEPHSVADFAEKSKLQENILEISSDTDKEVAIRSPRSPFETSGHESCELDMNEDMYFEANNMGELFDPSENKAKVTDVFAANTEALGEVPQRDTDSDIYNASTEVTTTEQSDVTADEIQPRRPSISSRKTKRLNSFSSKVVYDKKVKLREEEHAETTSDEDLYLAATQIDTSVASLLRQNTFGEPNTESKARTDTDSESALNRTPSLTPNQVKPKRKTASVKKLSTFKSSTVGKSVSFSSGAFDADTQLDDSPLSAQNSFSTSTPKITQDKPKSSLFQMKKLSFQDLYSAQTQVMPQASSKSEDWIDKSLDDDDADAALYSALDDLEETCLTSLDSKQHTDVSKMDDQYLAATQVMPVQVPRVESESEEEEDEAGDVYGACTQVVGGASPSSRKSLGSGDEGLDIYGAATQVDPTLMQDDVIVLEDDQEEIDEPNPFDVMTQVDEQEPDLKSDTSKSNVPVSLLKRIQSNHIQKKSILVDAENLKKKFEVVKDKKEKSTTKQLAIAGVEKSMFYPKPADKPSWLSKKKSPLGNVKSSTAASRRRKKQTSDNSFSLTQKIQVAKARQRERMHKAAVDPSLPISKMKPAASSRHASNNDVVLPDEDEIMAKGLPLLTFNKLVPKHKDEKRQSEAADSGQQEKTCDKDVTEVPSNSSNSSKLQEEEHKSISSKSLSHSSKSSSHSSKPSSHSSKSSSRSSKSSSHSSKPSSHSSKSSSRSSKSSSHSSKQSSHSSKSSSHSSRSSHSSSSGKSLASHTSNSSTKHHSSKSSQSSRSHHHSTQSSGNQKKEHTSQQSTPKTPAISTALPSISQPVTPAHVSSSPHPVSAESRRRSGNTQSASPEKESILDVLAREVTSPDVTKSSKQDKSFDLSMYPLPAKAKTNPSQSLESGNLVAKSKIICTANDGDDIQSNTDKKSTRLVTASLASTATKILDVKEPRKTIPINIVGSTKTGAAKLIEVFPRDSTPCGNRDPRLRASIASVQAQRPNLLLKPSAAVRPVVSGSSLMHKPAGPSRAHEAILPFSQVLRGAPATASTAGSSGAGPGSKIVQEPAKLLDSTYYLYRVLQWNPIWLQEQMKPEFANHPPPVLQPEECVYPLLESYTSLEDYQNIMTRLLLLDTWDTIFKEWKQKRTRRLNNVMFMSFDILNKQDKAGLGKFMWQGLLSREQMRRGQHPVEGELVIMNVWGAPLPANKEGMPAQVKPAWKATFGYVDRINIRPATNVHNLFRIYPVLKSSVENPRGELHLMTITALARYRRYRPIGDRVMSIEPLCHLVTSKRQFQALTYLPRSPLLRDILHPSSPRTFQHSTLIQERALLRSYNLSQAEAISAVCRSVQEPCHVPRICLLQGPPGTGKTHTITGIITKIIQDSKGKCCICLCTPSNGAADELTRRLIAIRNGGGSSAGMRVVRFGKTKSMHDDVVEVAYDELLDKERAKLEKKRRGDLSSLPESVKREQQQLRQRIERLQQEVASLSVSTSKIQIDRRTADIRKLERELQYLDRQQTAPARHVQLTASEEGRLRQRILEEAHVICGTLNSIGSARIMNILRTDRNRNHFICTIIDEATQSTELDCLIPLQYGTSKLVLVGDPEQLPPTIISQRAKEMKFGLSLFERLYTYFKSREHSPVLMLKTQYRMDAAILSFPNLYVYDGLLNTDRSVGERTRNFPLHPYLVFNNESGQESISSEGSVSNKTEANCVSDLCYLITSRTKILSTKIGVICPYQSQKTLVINFLSQKGLGEVEVNTVDGFQGREKHVIVMSCVRARSTDGSIGFLSDRRRLNVALTRAKYALFVIGHLDSLKRGADWRALIEDAQRRNVIVNIPTPEQFTRLAAGCFKTSSGSLPRH